jgi:dihydrofolate reductase
MIVSAIVAMGKDRQIGMNNQLLWRLSSDLKLFKEKTLGHTLIMGRKTFESIGRPLPGRTTFVISRNLSSGDLGPNVQIFSSVEEALKEAEKKQEKEVFVCGGGEIYGLAMSRVQRLYISKVEYDGKCDTQFPDIDLESWSVLESKQFLSDEKNEFDFEYVCLSRQ